MTRVTYGHPDYGAAYLDIKVFAEPVPRIPPKPEMQPPPPPPTWWERVRAFLGRRW